MEGFYPLIVTAITSCLQSDRVRSVHPRQSFVILCLLLAACCLLFAVSPNSPAKDDVTGACRNLATQWWLSEAQHSAIADADGGKDNLLPSHR